MPILSCYVTDATLATLQEYAREHHEMTHPDQYDINRKVEELAEAAIENAALESKRR